MRKSFFKIIISITVLGIFPVLAQNISDIDLTKETTAAEALLKSDIQIKPEFDACGENITMSGSKFSDGTYISTMSRRFETAGAAQEYLKNEIKNTVKIFEQKTDTFVTQSGKTTYREEGLVILKNESPSDFGFVRYHLFDRYLNMTFSSSLKHLLASEMISKQRNEELQKLLKEKNNP